MLYCIMLYKNLKRNIVQGFKYCIIYSWKTVYGTHVIRQSKVVANNLMPKVYSNVANDEFAKISFKEKGNVQLMGK